MIRNRTVFICSFDELLAGDAHPGLRARGYVVKEKKNEQTPRG